MDNPIIKKKDETLASLLELLDESDEESDPVRSVLNAINFVSNTMSLLIVYLVLTDLSQCPDFESISIESRDRKNELVKLFTSKPKTLEKLNPFYSHDEMIERQVQDICKEERSAWQEFIQKNLENCSVRARNMSAMVSEKIRNKT